MDAPRRLDDVFSTFDTTWEPRIHVETASGVPIG